MLPPLFAFSVYTQRCLFKLWCTQKSYICDACCENVPPFFSCSLYTHRFMFKLLCIPRHYIMHDISRTCFQHITKAYICIVFVTANLISYTICVYSQSALNDAPTMYSANTHTQQFNIQTNLHKTYFAVRSCCSFAFCSLVG